MTRSFKLPRRSMLLALACTLVGTTALAQEAVKHMQARKITCLFAFEEDGRPAGILHIHDCLRAGVA